MKRYLVEHVDHPDEWFIEFAESPDEAAEKASQPWDDGVVAVWELSFSATYRIHVKTTRELSLMGREA